MTMAIFRNLLPVIIYFLVVSFSSAQEPDPLIITYNPYRLASLADAQDAADQELKIGVKAYGLTLRYPALSKNDRVAIYNGLALDYLHFSYRDWDIQQRSYHPLDLYGLNYTLFCYGKLGKNWQVDIALMPGIYSDFKNFSGDDFTLQGYLALLHRGREGFAYGIGAAYLNIWGEPQVLPVIKLYWQLSSTYALDIDLPGQARINYDFLDGLELGLSGHLAGNYYHIGDDNFAGDEKSHHVKLSNGTAGVYMAIRVSGQLFWMVEFGDTFRRRLEFYRREQEALESFDLKNGFYFSTRLDLRPRVIY